MLPSRYKFIKYLESDKKSRTYLYDDTVTKKRVIIREVTDEKSDEYVVATKLKEAGCNMLFSCVENMFTTEDRRQYIVYEYFEGDKLSEVVGKVSEDLVFRLAGFLIAGLSYLHSKNIIHRDFVLDNILFNKESMKINIVGFVNSCWHYCPGKSRGFYSFTWPPEYPPCDIQHQNDISPDGFKKADVYALGIMLYELAVGKIFEECPYSNEALIKIKGGEYVFPDKVHLEKIDLICLREVIQLCLTPDPEERPSAKILMKVYIDCAYPAYVKQVSPTPERAKTLKKLKTPPKVSLKAKTPKSTKKSTKAKKAPTPKGKTPSEGRLTHESTIDYLIRRYPQKIVWKHVSDNPCLSPETIVKHIKKLDPIFLSQNPALTPEIIIKFQNIWDWSLLSSNPALTPSIIRKFKKRWNMEMLSRNPSLTPDIILEFEKEWDNVDDDQAWHALSYNRSLTPEIIKKFKNRLNWQILSYTLPLTLDIVREFKDNWDWNSLSGNESLTLEIIREFKTKWNWKNLSENPYLPSTIIQEFKDLWILWETSWRWLSKNLTLTPEIIRELKDRWDWEWLSENPVLTPDIIREFRNKWNWKNLSRNPALIPNIIREFQDRWDWDVLSENPSLTPDIIREFKDREDGWRWGTLSENPVLTPQIIDEFKNLLFWTGLSENEFECDPKLKLIRQKKIRELRVSPTKSTYIAKLPKDITEMLAMYM